MRRDDACIPSTCACALHASIEPHHNTQALRAKLEKTEEKLAEFRDKLKVELWWMQSAPHLSWP